MKMARNAVFWGMILLSFHINLFGLPLFPEFVGAALLVWGIWRLAEAGGGSLSPVGKGLAVVWIGWLAVSFGLGWFQADLDFGPWRLERWLTLASVILEYGTLWTLFTSLGNVMNWGGEYDRRIFLAQLTMGAACLVCLSGCLKWSGGSGVAAAVLVVIARFQFLFGSLKEETGEETPLPPPKEG